MAMAVVDQDAQVQQLAAEMHGIAAADFDSDEQAFAPHFLDMGRVRRNLLYASFQFSALPGGSLRQVFLGQYVQGRYPGEADQGITAVGGTVQSGLNPSL